MTMEKFTPKIIAGLLVGLLAIGAVSNKANAVTTTVTFGWEDGTSTTKIDINGDTVDDLPAIIFTPDSSAIALANVSSGTQIDYGPSSNPFITPETEPVTPFDGTRMLEVSLTPNTIDGGNDGVVYLGAISGLNPGDTYRYTYYTRDPSNDRSPSATTNASFGNIASVATFDGFAVRLQRFVLNEGWLESQLDGNPPSSGSVQPGSANQPDVPAYRQFDYNGNGPLDGADYVVWRDNNGTTNTILNDSSPGSVNATDYTNWRSNFGKTLSDSVFRLEADLTYQSLTQTNGGIEKYYIDGLTISVTSNSPTAKIYLPNGTSVLVNPGVGSAAGVPEPASGVLLLLGLVALCGRRRAA